MTEIDFMNIVGPMPPFVSIDLRSQLARLNSMTTFDYMYPNPAQRSDAILSKVVAAVMDRQFINVQVANLSRYFMNSILLAIENTTLSSTEGNVPDRTALMRFHGYGLDSRLSVMDDLIAFEQTALDIADVLQQLKLYRYNRFLPYVYETTLNPRAVVLTKINDYEFLCDQIPTLSMNPFMEPD